MDREWVETNLDSIINNNIIVCSSDENGNMMGISIDNFVSLFSNVQNPTYENLKSYLPVNSGWSDTFDTWHNQGLIKLSE